MNGNPNTMNKALAAFLNKPLYEASLAFFTDLGYVSKKRLRIDSVKDLRDKLDTGGYLDDETALLGRWKSVHMLFQLTEGEISKSSGGQLALELAESWEPKDIRSYLFFAVELEVPADGAAPSRTELSKITRAINRLVPMPVLVLFKHGKCISLAVINRRKNMKDGSRDVLTRVSLIRNISCDHPHRAHLDLLDRFSVTRLKEESGALRSFNDLDTAWQKLLSTQELNLRFYRELVDWFTWANGEIKLACLPDHVPDTSANRTRATQEFTVRLICRLLFSWFLKEMRLIPGELLELYDAADRPRILTKVASKRGFGNSNEYYRGILQNIFFKALNCPMDKRRKPAAQAKNDPETSDPKLAKLAYVGKQNLPEDFDYDLLDRIPYLNGGLFDALPEDNLQFTHVERTPFKVPNKLFYATRDEGFTVSAGGKGKKNRSVEGINRIFDRYRFTVAENTPLEEDVALDPELLGLVFENLLAEIDPTDDAAAESARKASGSYYTPRRIVDYMVNEALHLHLRTRFEKDGATKQDLLLLSQLCYRADGIVDFSPIAERVVAFLDEVRVLDAAVGSGAFPMGMLHRIVELLALVDPDNERWKRRLLARLPRAMREDAARGMEQKSYNYLRKLGLIQKNLYGLDIQPLAALIAKLRFFLTLVIEQEVSPADRSHNYGLQPLPNLETNLLCCNSLEDGEHDMLAASTMEKLREAREEYYEPGTTQERRDELAQEIGDALARLYPGFAEQVRGIKPANEGLRHEQDKHWFAEWFKHATVAAPFFDVDSFFPELVAEAGHTRTAPFHIVIGNPPYGGTKIPDAMKDRLGLGSKDPYGAFMARFMGSDQGPLANDGVLAFIVSDTFMTIKTHKPLRQQLLGHRIHKMLRVSGDTFRATVNCAVVLLQRGGATADQVCQMADLTNLSIHDQYERFLHILFQTEGFARRQSIANQTYAIYYYKQSLIGTNTNIPFYVASPKLFALMNDTAAPTSRVEFGGRAASGRSVTLSGRSVTILKLGSIAEVVGGVKTYDNDSYVRSATGSGRYQKVDEHLIVRRRLTQEEQERGIALVTASTPRFVEFDKSGKMITGDGRLVQYYKPPEFYIDWSREAVTYFASVNGLRNRHRYFQAGITYSVTGVYAPTFRVGCGKVFGQKGATLFVGSAQMYSLLGILCSLPTRYLVKSYLSHGVDATDSLIEDIPILATPLPEIGRLVTNILQKLGRSPDYDFSVVEQIEIDHLVYQAYGFDASDIREVENWYARRYPKLAQAQRRALAAKEGKAEEQLVERQHLRLYCDESAHLPHDEEPNLLLGMLVCPEEATRGALDDLETLWKKHGMAKDFEAKWTKVGKGALPFYRALLDWFLAIDQLRFRTKLLPDKQKAFAKLPEDAKDHLYYRFYFDFLRNSIEPDNRYRAFLDLKDTRGRDKLRELEERLHADAGDMVEKSIELQHIRSHEVRLLQVCDLLLGAVGFARKPRRPEESKAKRELVEHLEAALGFPLSMDSPPGSERFIAETLHDQEGLLL
ncbi:MAG: DUF3800 domain-containing protein [Sumerlaeia bacterium]